MAGDDVDVCWRIQARGWTLGFNPAAVVWHHRRRSVRTYWKQQRGYGRAEALLEAKWPEKYNALGHLNWAGRIYGAGLMASLAARRGRVYGGTWGSAPFQPLDQPAPGVLASLLLLPEWYLLSLVLAVLALLGLSWHPLLLALPLCLASLVVPLAQALLGARRALARRPSHAERRLAFLALTAVLFALQPMARLIGRFRSGLMPWRHQGGPRDWRLLVPARHPLTLWSERWESGPSRLAALEAALARNGARVTRGGDFDRWDLEVRGGLTGSARLVMAIEEHGGGRQFIRVRVRPVVSLVALAAAFGCLALAMLAGLDGGGPACLALSAISVAIAVAAWLDSARATAAIATAWAPDPASVLSAVMAPGPGN